MYIYILGWYISVCVYVHVHNVGWVIGKKNGEGIGKGGRERGVGKCFLRLLLAVGGGIAYEENGIGGEKEGREERMMTKFG